MKKIFIIFIFALCTTLLAGKSPYIWVYSNGSGKIDIFWLPSDIWPSGGWKLVRVTDGNKKILKNQLKPLTLKKYINNISKNEYEKIKKFAKELEKRNLKKDELQIAKVVMGVKAASNKYFGYLLGLRYEDILNTKKSVYYIIYALDKNGKAISSAKSIKVSPFKKSLPPKSVENAAAKSTPNGVEIYFSKPKLNKQNPIIGYKIKRIDNDGSSEWITKNTKILSNDIFLKKLPAVLDKNPPIETKVKYEIYSVGFFENMSKPVEISVYVKDFTALMPPLNFSAEGKKGKVILKWNKKESENCFGYLIERSNMQKGPFLILTPKGITKEKNIFEDKNVIGGVSYFYRIRSVNKNGEIGNPSVIRAATPISKSPPSPPRNLKAKVGKTLIMLSWEKPKKGDIAGYKVYRKSKDAKKWMQLNSYLIKDRYFEDPYDVNVYGEFQYMVKSAGYDSQESKKSNIIKVYIPDQVPPNPPIITDIKSQNGIIKISFKPSPPYEDIEKFYLIRSIDPNDPGLVIGDAIDKKSRSIEDKFIKYGQRYWYSMIAVDKAGNRSDLSRKFSIVAENPPLPKPDKPKLSYKDKPVKHVIISIKKVPRRAFAIIFKSLDKKKWEYVATTDEAGDIVDTKVIGNKIYYKIYFKSENNSLSEPSKIAKIKIE
ncbi:fibronectin type III domain-containing protein [Nitrosophilus kaiyonis]|uniref:fibronectin type III domain-containing protein n=1 Tax=Nitrosophilus kaiyonis TaxID=2930200 RepID=UPI002492176E|nr:hypothetical protein [Nitrosophilus kaiyonis]